MTDDSMNRNNFCEKPANFCERLGDFCERLGFSGEKPGNSGEKPGFFLQNYCCFSFFSYLCRCIVAAWLLCKTSWVEKDIVSDSEVIRKLESPYQ